VEINNESKPGADDDDEPARWPVIGAEGKAPAFSKFAFFEQEPEAPAKEEEPAAFAWPETSIPSTPAAASPEPQPTAPLPPPEVLERPPKPEPAEAPPPGRSFKRKGRTPKLGIIGGKGVGKSYLFQAMVYRTYSNAKAGALAYYLDRGGIRLYTAIRRDDPERELNLARFVENYTAWKRLDTTRYETQRWYRLSLPYRTGIFGLGRSQLDVEFFEASGEGLLQLEYMGKQELELWKDAYLDAQVMVFCLPLWAAFPREDLTEEDWREREDILKGFDQVVLNYRRLRDEHNPEAKVRGILALTMADDPRTYYDHLRDRWITPYIDAPRHYLKELSTGRGIARYMANARKVSDAVRLEFDDSNDPRVSSIPNRLDFDAGKPWLIPLSAVEGRRLEEHHGQHFYPGRFMPPVPVHVELPLLVALCDKENALM